MLMSRFFNSALMASKPATQYSVCKVSKATPTVSFLPAELFGDELEDLSQPAKINAHSRPLRRRSMVFMIKISQTRVSNIRDFAQPTPPLSLSSVPSVARAASTVRGQPFDND